MPLVQHVIDTSNMKKKEQSKLTLLVQQFHWWSNYRIQIMSHYISNLLLCLSVSLTRTRTGNNLIITWFLVVSRQNEVIYVVWLGRYKCMNQLSRKWFSQSLILEYDMMWTTNNERTPTHYHSHKNIIDLPLNSLLGHCLIIWCRKF